MCGFNFSMCIYLNDSFAFSFACCYTQTSGIVSTGLWICLRSRMASTNSSILDKEISLQEIHVSIQGYVHVINSLTKLSVHSIDVPIEVCSVMCPMDFGSHESFSWPVHLDTWMNNHNEKIIPLFGCFCTATLTTFTRPEVLYPCCLLCCLIVTITWLEHRFQKNVTPLILVNQGNNCSRHVIVRYHFR